MSLAKRFFSAALLCFIGLLPMGLLASTCAEGEIVVCEEEVIYSQTCRSMTHRSRIRASSLENQLDTATKIKRCASDPSVRSYEHSDRNGFGGPLTC